MTLLRYLYFFCILCLALAIFTMLKSEDADREIHRPVASSPASGISAGTP